VEIMIPTNLTAGDIVFFASTHDTDSDAGYTQFAHLAGSVQSLAYPDRLPRPWHHVGVMVSPTDIVEFAQVDDGVADQWDPGLVRHMFTVPDDQVVTVLRHRAFADGLVEGSLALVEAGAEYDVTSLLGFAAATQARLFSAGSAARRRTMDLALGAVELAPTSTQRPRGTCVSMVLDALDAVITPTEPAGGVSIPGELPNEVSTPIDRLITRVQGGREGQALTTGADDIDQVLDDLTTIEGYGGSGNTPMTQVPGFIGTTREYLAMIARLVRGSFADTSAEKMIAAGVAWRRRNPGATPAVLVSPAMLFDALIISGFRRVTLKY
jgi:hypothetical protein